MADDDKSSIPSVVDGLTRLQRTILLCALKNPSYQKVEDFCGYVSENSPAYRGKQRLVATTMTDMAQSYPGGNNNINLLHPSAASSSSSIYTHTQLSSITSYVFHPSDEPLLQCLNEEDLDELPWMMPVIPMILVNGCETIGTRYNPRDVIANIRRLLKDEKLVPMDPWCKGVDEDTWRKTETSLGGVVEGFPNNAHLLDRKGRKKEYGGYEKILQEFVPLRLEYYEKRKSAMLDAVIRALAVLEQLSSKQEYDKGFVYEDECNTSIRDKDDLVLLAELDNYYSFQAGMSSPFGEFEYPHPQLYEKLDQFHMLTDSTARDLWSRDLDDLDTQLYAEYLSGSERKEKWMSVCDSKSEEEEPSDVQHKDDESKKRRIPPEQDEEDETRKRLRTT